MTDWAAAYDPGVPRSLAPYPDRTLLDLLREAARERPESAALLFKGSVIGWGRLERLSAAMSAALAALGVAKGDRVALLLPNSPQALIALFGAWGAGAIAVPMNPLYTASELEPMLREVGCETAVVLTPFYEKVRSVKARAGIRRVIATSVKEHLPPLKRLLFTLLKERKAGHRLERLDPGDHWMPDLLARHARDPAPRVEPKADDEAVVLFTGGTTGTPKGAVGSHRIVATGLQYASWAAWEPWKEVIVLNVPLFHVMGMAGVLPAWLVGRGTACLVPNPRDLDDMIAAMREARPTFLPAVPTLLIGLLAHPAVKAGRAGFDRLRLCICGSAPLMVDTKRRFEELTGCHVCEGYSLTEAMMAAVATPVLRDRPGSVGVPQPDVDVRVVGSDGSDLPAGEVGEILLRAPQLMLRYWNRPAETAEVLRDGWLRTGDLGSFDAEGYLFIADRIKDLIKVSGSQVWPREVEEVLATHPAVAEVSVAGVPDPYQGEAVKAWIVLRPGQQVTADELRARCRERLAPYKVPKHVEFRDALPRSLIGKVLRRELRAGEPKAAPAASRPAAG